MMVGLGRIDTVTVLLLTDAFYFPYFMKTSQVSLLTMPAAAALQHCMLRFLQILLIYISINVKKTVVYTHVNGE